MARILIADDEEAIRSLVARALSQDGHQVTTARDGAEALDLLTGEHGTFDGQQVVETPAHSMVFG